MSTLTGQKIANTYKQLLQVSTDNSGLSATVQTVQDGAGTNSALQLSNSTVNINGTFQVNGNSVALASSLAATSAALATSIETANTRITSVSDFAVALSATFATSINNSNLNIAAVSVLTSVNTEAITSINVILGGSGFATNAELAATSLALATSIDTANTRITSVSNFAVALSATFATSINNSNTNIAAVSVLTSVNLESITSINSVVNNLDFATSAELAATSLALATSIGTANTRITSVSNFAVALSATFATSINNSNTNITTNINAITSINSILGDGSNFATDAELAAVSSALATSIATADTRITSVSNYSVALSATLATSIANHLPLAGGTLTGTVSGTDFYVSAVAIGVDTLLGKQLHLGTAAVADIVSLTDGTSIAVDFNAGQNFAVQLAGNRILESPTNCVAGQTGSIFVIQDGTGGRTLSYGGNWKFPAGTAPTISTAISAVDRLDYIAYTSTAVHAIATLDVK
jgi:hypothetical protein